IRSSQRLVKLGVGLMVTVIAAALAWAVWDQTREVLKPILPKDIRSFLFEFRLILDLVVVFLVLTGLEAIWSRISARLFRTKDAAEEADA
ncbi:MAG: hypothetical protein ACPGYL_11615, partial [Rhodospirillaceae bacterium]